jgi:hypothetical protein
MGADSFTETTCGKDAASAFADAVREARHWNGHGGYTGTIAEKSGFRVVALPPRVSAQKFLAWIWSSETGDLKEVPAKHRAAVKAAGEIAFAKWGPALCFEITATAAKRDFKRRLGRAGTRDRVFVFTGLASC